MERSPALGIVDVMGRTNTAGVEIRAYRPEDGPHVVNLLQTAFGTWPHGIEGQAPAEFFRWKHMESPFGRSILMVAEADGAVVGFEGWLRWRLRAGGRTFQAVRGVDLVVDPEHRRRGIHTAFMREAKEDFPQEAAFTFSNPNEQSRSGTLKAGRHDAGTMPNFIRVRAPIRAGLRLIYEKRRGEARVTTPPADAEPAAVALEDGHGVSSLLAQAEEASDRFMTAKDLDYLRWRYGSLVAYRAIREEREGRLVGMAIFRVRRRGPLSASTVCELLVEPGDLRTAHHLLRRAVQAAPVDYLTCHFPSGSAARRAAVRCGFVRLRGDTLTTVQQLKEGIVPDPTRRDSWALCLGDLDLL